MVLPPIPLTLTVAGSISNVFGSYFSARGQRAALRYQAEIADINARLSELGAQSALRRGQREEQGVRLRTARLKSSQRVALAANGIDLGQGSAQEILNTTDVMGEIDANTVAANAVRDAWGYRTQGVNYQNEALMKRATASAISPIGAAAGTLLGEAGSVSKTWYAMDKAGMLDEFKANRTDDPIGAMGDARGWWSK